MNSDDFFFEEFVREQMGTVTELREELTVMEQELQKALGWLMREEGASRQSDALCYAVFRVECHCGQNSYFAICLDDPFLHCRAATQDAAVARLKEMVSRVYPTGEQIPLTDLPIPDSLPADFGEES